ncbi:MAG: FAD-linked oxidase C-terminal domain-containing protein [Thermodesulfobacteriota bacterium]|nr:FAD-linked oxidase C-terminal domain-containing protein [Thermodesulfobacteriota bacterium]
MIPVISKVAAIVGQPYVSTANEDLLCYAYDATNRHHLPDGVVFPGKTEEVSAIMKVVNEAGVYVVPRGAGTGMSGGALAVQGGLVMVMTRFNRVLSVDVDNLLAEVEPGVITAHFQEVVERKGLFYPPDPASAKYSTLGGNVAECAGGPRAVKYGVTRDYVLGLEVVLPSGEIITTGVHTAKGVVGYDLTRLIAGSEGTLGIVTKIVLRLVPLPEVVRTLGAVFGRIRDAARTVSEIVRSGLMPRTLEYMDQAAIRCVEDYLKIGLPVDAGAMLLVEVDGSPPATDTALQHLATICEKGGGREIRVAHSEQEAKALWRAREAISPALFRLGPHKINEDIVVPRNRIPDMVEWIEDLRKRTGLTMVTFGHAGDGNIHFNIMLDKGDKKAVNKAEAAVEELFRHTISLGGTISGEHGVGITKAPYLEMELGDPEIALMKRIKAAFDPKGILNPGKIFPPPVPFH